MISLDLPFAEEEFDVVNGISRMVLVNLQPHTFYSKIKIDTIIRFCFYDNDEYYNAIDENPELLTKVEPKSLILFEVEYLRETKLKNVSKKEWDSGIYATSLKEYIEDYDCNINDYVKITSATRLSYSFKELNAYRDSKPR